jgi:hypothetical protein
MSTRKYFTVWVRMPNPLTAGPVAVGMQTRERADADLVVDYLTSQGIEAGWTETVEGLYVCACCAQTRRCACDKGGA